MTRAKLEFFSFFPRRGRHNALFSLAHAVRLLARLLLADRRAVKLCRVLPTCHHDSIWPISNTGLTGALPVAKTGLQEEAFVSTVRLLNHHPRVHHGGHCQELDIRVSVGNGVPTDATTFLQVSLTLLLCQWGQGHLTGLPARRRMR